MTKVPKKQDQPAPDAWDRFERAVDVAVKTNPMHKPSKKKTIARKRKKQTTASYA